MTIVKPFELSAQAYLRASAKFSPKKLGREFSAGIQTGLNGYADNFVSGVHPKDVLFKVAEKKTGDITVIARKPGLKGIFNSAIRGEFGKDTIPKKEFEHGLGGLFGDSFSRASMNLKMSDGSFGMNEDHIIKKAIKI